MDQRPFLARDFEKIVTTNDDGEALDAYRLSFTQFGAHIDTSTRFGFSFWRVYRSDKSIAIVYGNEEWFRPDPTSAMLSNAIIHTERINVAGYYVGEDEPEVAPSDVRPDRRSFWYNPLRFEIAEAERVTRYTNSRSGIRDRAKDTVRWVHPKEISIVRLEMDVDRKTLCSVVLAPEELSLYTREDSLIGKSSFTKTGLAGLSYTDFISSIEKELGSKKKKPSR